MFVCFDCVVVVGLLRIVNFGFSICYRIDQVGNSICYRIDQVGNSICYRIDQVGNSICKDECYIVSLYHDYLLLYECCVLN